MQELRSKDLTGWTIIEHRADGGNIVGKIEVGGVRGDRDDGSLDVAWHHYDNLSLHRTTTFLSSCWRSEFAAAGVIFLKRTAKEPPELELSKPWHDANLYTLVQTCCR
jgi:hypothetical protein